MKPEPFSLEEKKFLALSVILVLFSLALVVICVFTRIMHWSDDVIGIAFAVYMSYWIMYLLWLTGSLRRKSRKPERYSPTWP